MFYGPFYLAGSMSSRRFWENEQKMNSGGVWKSLEVNVNLGMNLEKYLFDANEDRTRFDFESKGPNGAIKKMGMFDGMGQLRDGTQILNLGFGDANESHDGYNDNVTSNNADRNKILATVANTILDVINHLGNAVIYANGRTPARTRLYQMGINAHKAEIDDHLDIFGETPLGWENFRPGVNYSAFIATKKNYKIE